METLSSKVNSPEDQVKIKARTQQENILMNIDGKIAKLRTEAALYGDVNGYNAKLEEMFALQNLREALVSSYARTEARSDEPLSAEDEDSVAVLKLLLFTIISAAVFFLGFVTHALLY